MERKCLGEPIRDLRARVSVLDGKRTFEVPPETEGMSSSSRFRHAPADERRNAHRFRGSPRLPEPLQLAEWNSKRKDMHMRSIVSGLAAAGLLVASTASVAAAPAMPADARMSSPALATEATSGDSTWLWIAGGVALLVVLFLILDDGDEDLPTSP
jgi:hypothetical protein